MKLTLAGLMHVGVWAVVALFGLVILTTLGRVMLLGGLGVWHWMQL